MDIIESVRLAMRKRIVLEASIVPQAKYQRQGYAAPDTDFYIRETVTEYTHVEDSQTSELIIVLCAYDVFVRRANFADVVQKASEIGSLIKSEFNVKNAAKLPVLLANWGGGVEAWIDKPPKDGTDTEEPELYRHTVMIYVAVRVPLTANYETGGE